MDSPHERQMIVLRETKLLHAGQETLSTKIGTYVSFELLFNSPVTQILPRRGWVGSINVTGIHMQIAGGTIRCADVLPILNRPRGVTDCVRFHPEFLGPQFHRERPFTPANC